MRKHIKSEHEVVKYKLELNLAMALLTEKEAEEMITRMKDRLDSFQETGVLDTSKDLFWQTGNYGNYEEEKLSKKESFGVLDEGREESPIEEVD